MFPLWRYSLLLVYLLNFCAMISFFFFFFSPPFNAGITSGFSINSAFFLFYFFLKRYLGASSLLIIELSGRCYFVLKPRIYQKASGAAWYSLFLQVKKGASETNVTKRRHSRITREEAPQSLIPNTVTRPAIFCDPISCCPAHLDLFRHVVCPSLIC